MGDLSPLLMAWGIIAPILFFGITRLVWKRR